MNRAWATKLAKSGKITRPQLRAMLKKAYDEGYCNENRSRLNAQMSRAVVFNINWKVFGVPADDVPLPKLWVAVYNCLVEFGNYGDFPKAPPPREYQLPPIHHIPAIDIYKEQK